MQFTNKGLIYKCNQYRDNKNTNHKKNRLMIQKKQVKVTKEYDEYMFWQVLKAKSLIPTLCLRLSKTRHHRS